MQNEVTECLLTWHNADHSLATSLPSAVVAVDRDIRAVLQRQNVSVAEHSVHTNSTTADSVAFELQNLSATTATTSATATSSDNTLFKQFETLHAPTLLAAHSVLNYLHMWKNSAHHHALDITLGTSKSEVLDSCTARGQSHFRIALSVCFFASCSVH